MSQPLSDFRGQSAAGVPPSRAGEPAPDSQNPYQSPGIPEAPEIVQSPPPPAISPLASQIAVLMQQGKNGAKWFYWIAGFSMVNTLIMLVSGGLFFVVGLAVTCLADGIAQVNAQQAPEFAVVAKVVAFGFSAAMSLLFCGFGWLAGGKSVPALVCDWDALVLIGWSAVLADGTNDGRRFPCLCTVWNVERLSGVSPTRGPGKETNGPVASSGDVQYASTACY